MAMENWKKLKILKLVELLRKDTDEQHPLTTDQICYRMEDMGIPYDRRTLSVDVALLNEQGIEVLWKWVGKAKGYYIEDRSFSEPELKILIDAVQAAGFINEKKTAEMIDKIAELGGTHRADILKSNVVCFNARKHGNESIYYIVDAIETALRKSRKITFRYFDLGTDGERIYRKEGQRYVADPVALVFNEDNYYALVYSGKHEGIATYRVDWMDNVEVKDKEISKTAVKKRDKVKEYTQEAFKMYGGPLKDVVLEFDKTLIGSVYDRFGEGTEMIPSGEDKVRATVRVQISPTFWGWLFQFGRKMRILSPESVVEERNARVAELMGCYDN